MAVFEIAELGRKMGKKEYREAVPQLRVDLLEVQRRLEDADFPVIILLNGVEGAGKGEALNMLYEWMDARSMYAHALGEPNAAQAERPEYWRFWMALPPKGRIGIFVGNWYTQPIVQRAFERMGPADFERHIAKINAFEKALVDGGALVHQGVAPSSRKKAQRQRRFKKLGEEPRHEHGACHADRTGSTGSRSYDSVSA